jgi:phosphatidylethanolamine-binding protein (PEBP) family uncharacterized protein
MKARHLAKALTRQIQVDLIAVGHLQTHSRAIAATLEKAMKGHILAEAQVMGKYGR